MPEIAIIADEDIALGFKAFGFKVYTTKDAADCKIIFDAIVREKPSICLVQDDIYNKAAKYLEDYRHLSVPVFVPFSKDGKTDLLNKMIKDIRLKATGAF